MKKFLAFLTLSVTVGLVASNLAPPLAALQTSTTVSGQAFEDHDLDGIFDSDDIGLGGILVTVTSNTGQVVTTTTAGNGSYSSGISGTCLLYTSDAADE